MKDDTVEIKLNMTKIDNDRYFCNGQRLAFDLPWAIYRVNNDLYFPYFRIYIGEVLMGIQFTMQGSYEYIQNMSSEAAHIANM